MRVGFLDFDKNGKSRLWKLRAGELRGVVPCDCFFFGPKAEEIGGLAATMRYLWV